MAFFNFNVQEKATKKKNKDNLLRKVIEKNVAGVVWVNRDASYKVKIAGKVYDFTQESYSCKGRQFVFHTFKDKNRYCHVRNPDKRDECDTRYWRPFTAGCIVLGNIVSEDGKELFDVKDITIDLQDHESHDALEYFRRNYDEIKENFLNLINNGI